MGNEVVRPPDKPDISFFAMKLFYGPSRAWADTIRVVYHEEEVAAIVKDSLCRVLINGKMESMRASPTQIKLSFTGDAVREFAASGTAYPHQYCLAALLQDLLARGWHLAAPVNLAVASKNCTLFFCKDASLPLRPSECPILALRLHSAGELHLVNAEQAVKEMVRDQVLASWSQGIQTIEELNDTECKFHLNGSPWRAESFGPELMEGRLMVMNIVQALQCRGCEVYTSCHPGDAFTAVDTIYFTRHSRPIPIGEAFILGLLCSDEVYLVRAPPQAVDVVRWCILRTWPDGITAERALPGLVVFTLKYSPWRSSSMGFSDGHLTQSDANARQLVALMFQELRRVGWRLHTTLDLCEALYDVSCFMMTACAPEERQFMVVSLQGERHIRLLNAPPSALRVFAEELPAEWPDVFRVGKEMLASSEIVLPYKFADCVELFCIVLDRLSKRGWKVVSSADLSANFQRRKQQHSHRHISYPLDLHTLIMEYRPPTESPPPPSYAEAMAGGDAAAQAVSR